MNGLELARAIKADPALTPTRLVLLTSQGQRGDAKAAQAAGYAGYLSKPVHAPQLYDCLTAVLKTSAQAFAFEGQSEGRTVRPEFVTRHSLAEKNAQAIAKILVAEDNAVNQKVAIRMLEKLGYRADLVANGLEALDALTRISYDAILMDCQMPEMDGFQATRLIREREQARGNVESGIQNDEMTLAGSPSSIPHSPFLIQHSQRVPIIAMTANALQEDRGRCLAAGMDDYLSKPVQPKVLAEVLARWVSAPALISTSTDERPAQRASSGAA
jgi:CheY-like chemotaxis protein